MAITGKHNDHFKEEYKRALSWWAAKAELSADTSRRVWATQKRISTRHDAKMVAHKAIQLIALALLEEDINKSPMFSLSMQTLEREATQRRLVKGKRS